MRYLAKLVAILLLVGCGDVPDSRQQPAAIPPAPEVTHEQAGASADSVAERLVAWAAADFDANRPPYPDRVRAVRLASVPHPEGGRQYMLCGEFLSTQPGGTAAWAHFVTIQTAPYEQWLGGWAGSVCAEESVTPETGVGDLSLTLQARLDTLR